MFAQNKTIRAHENPRFWKWHLRTFWTNCGWEMLKSLEYLRLVVFEFEEQESLWKHRKWRINHVVFVFSEAKRKYTPGNSKLSKRQVARLHTFTDSEQVFGWLDQSTSGKRPDLAEDQDSDIEVVAIGTAHTRLTAFSYRRLRRVEFVKGIGSQAEVVSIPRHDEQPSFCWGLWSCPSLQVLCLCNKGTGVCNPSALVCLWSLGVRVGTVMSGVIHVSNTRQQSIWLWPSGLWL